MKLFNLPITIGNLDIENIEYVNGEFFTIPIKAPWDTYIQVSKYSEINSLSICIWTDLSEVKIMAEIDGEIQEMTYKFSSSEKEMFNNILSTLVK